jgi:hypothetical protein
MERNHHEIGDLLERSERELLLQIYDQMPGHPLGAMPPAEEGRIMKIRNWLEGKRIHICAAIGASKKVKGLLKDKKVVNRVNLVSAIADAIISVVGDAPVIMISVLIVKYGMFEFCPNLQFKHL